MATFLKGTASRVPAKIIKKTKISPDSYLYRLGFEKESQELGMPCGQHFRA